MHDAGTTPNGVFGSKLMWDHMEGLVVRLRQLDDAPTERSLIEHRFPTLRFVQIWREDVAAQAISWAKAIQTGHWHHWDAGDPSAVPIYDREQIDALARKVDDSNSRWRAWFAASDVQPLVVRFEDLVANPIDVTREVLEYLGLASERITVAEQTVEPGGQVEAFTSSGAVATSEVFLFDFVPGRSESRTNHETFVDGLVRDLNIRLHEEARAKRDLGKVDLEPSGVSTSPRTLGRPPQADASSAAHPFR